VAGRGATGGTIAQIHLGPHYLRDLGGDRAFLLCRSESR
jgi:hypothetical protein